MDKGYQGAGKYVRAITSKKKSIERSLNRMERYSNY